MSLIPVITILILSFKDKKIYQYVCSDEQSAINHVIKHLQEYLDYELRDSYGCSYTPQTIKEAEIILKRVLGKGYNVTITEDEIDSFITEDDECHEEHDVGEN